jgi:hypothetical protein
MQPNSSGLFVGGDPGRVGRDYLDLMTMRRGALGYTGDERSGPVT